MADAPRLHHEDVDAYKAAIEFLALAAGLLDGDGDDGPPLRLRSSNALT